MNRLRLEGTPRIKRERRQHAPPISPLAADTEFADFMIPMGENGEDFDFGTAAMKMLEGIRRNDEDGFEAVATGPDGQNRQNGGLVRIDSETDIDPPSPSPGGDVMLGQDMVLPTAAAQRRSGEYHRRSKIHLARRSVNEDGGADGSRSRKEREGDGMEYMDGDD